MPKKSGSINLSTVIWSAVVKECQGPNPPTTRDELLTIASAAIGPSWRRIRAEWLLADFIRREVRNILAVRLIVQPIKPGPYVVDCECGDRKALFYRF